MLWNGVEATNQSGVECDICRYSGEIGMEVVPELGGGKLSWILWVEVLKNDVHGPAGDPEESACQGLV